MEVAIQKFQKLSAVAEKIQQISTSVYLQWGVVVSLLALTALFVEFRVTTQVELKQLHQVNERREKEMEIIKQNYITKDWLDAKLETIRLEIKQSQFIKDKQQDR